MRNVIFIFILLSFGVVSAETLKSLPSEWSGVAGDLVTRVPAKFVIDSSSLVKESNGSEEYNIEGAFTFDQRVVKVNKLNLRKNVNKTTKVESIEMTVFTDDELVPNLFVTIVKNKSDNIYVMQDITSPPLGRRLLLKSIN